MTIYRDSEIARAHGVRVEGPMTTQASCRDRIAAHKDSRLGHIAALNTLASVYDDDTRDEARRELADDPTLDDLGLDENASAEDHQEQADTALCELPLSVEVLRTVKILLSTGGPGDWLEVTLDAENDPIRAEYHFHDWFDHASVTLEGDEYDTAVSFADRMTGGFYFPEN